MSRKSEITVAQMFEIIAGEQRLIKTYDQAVYEVKTDDMDPTIHKGDMVIIDRSDNNIENEGIYLFEDDDRKFIRRLILIPEKHLVNDNQKLIRGSIFLDSSINCIGRVIWFSRKI